MATVTYLFKTGGAVGNTPPTQTQLDTAYTGTTLEGLVTVTNGIQKWVVPANGKYTIIARGAAGGKGTGSTANNMLGGFGAIITGTFQLKKNDALYIVVGQKGTDSPIGTEDGVTAGGGGMSAILKEVVSSPYLLNGTIPVELLVIAGAGNGGGDQAYSGKPGQNAILNQGSNDDYKTSSYSGGGFDAFYDDNTCGSSLLAGAAASQYVYTRSGRSSQAGFGGGAGNTDDGQGSGGGGYRGGVRGSNAGSSFNAGEEPHAILNTVRTDGSVDIIQTIIYKKLVLNNTDGKYYYHNGTAWVSIGDTATGAEFEEYGMEQIKFALLSYFTDYKIYAYTGDADDTKISTLITHKPLVQSAARIVSIDFTNKILTSGHLTATSEARVLVSVNEGKTWQTYNNGWQEVDVSDLSLAFAGAMPATAFNAVHKNSWAVLNITELRLMFLVDTDDIENAIKVSGLTFSYIQKEV